MDISGMLNPEGRRDRSPQRSASRTITYSDTTVTIPRSNVPTAMNSPLSSHRLEPSEPSYSYAYKPYNPLDKPCAAPTNIGSTTVYSVPIGVELHRNAGGLSSPTKHTLKRVSSTDSAAYESLRATNTVHSPMGMYHPPMNTTDRNYTTISSPPGYYSSPSNVHGANHLTALATVATSRCAQDLPSDRLPFASENARNSRGFENPLLTRNAPQQYNAIRRESQPISPRGTVHELECFGTRFPLSISGTVSVGSQTSRSNTPEQGGREVSINAPALLNTSPTYVGNGSPTNLTPATPASPVSPQMETIPESPESDDVRADEDHKCSYTESCETGSPLRKVVSHFFGRNKLATRKIPKHLWVYFCRKHYQRSRYRNPRGFASLQIQLVETQIGNLKKWGGVLDWTVKVRRREEIRTKSTSAATKANTGDEIEHVDARAPDNRRGSGVGGSIPSHYLKYVGEKKTMDEVIALVATIRQDMATNGGKFPDLELLPTVSDDVLYAEGKSKGSDRGRGRQSKSSKAKPAPACVRKRRAATPKATTASSSMARNITQLHPSQNQMPAIQPTTSGKRKLEIRAYTENPGHSYPVEEETLDTSYSFSQQLTPKRPRLSCPTSDISARRDSIADSQQTATPPLSVPGGSRRASSAAECDPVTTVGVNNNILDRVDAALENVKAGERYESFTAINTNIQRNGTQEAASSPYVSRQDMHETIVVARRPSC